MNLVMASVLLLAMLAFQPTLIYGTKNLASARTSRTSNNNNRNVRSSSKYGKRHSTEPLYSPALSSSSLSSAKLVMSMESGDVLVRAARGALTDNQNSPAAATATGNTNISNGGGSGGGSVGKRQKNNNNKKINNKNTSTHESPVATSSTSLVGRKRFEKKLSGTQHEQQHQQQNNNNKANNNKQRQMLKSQNHDGKRSGVKANKEKVEKTQSESEKQCKF